MKNCTARVINEALFMTFATCMFLIVILAIIGNFLIIFVVIKDPLKKLHEPFNFYLVALAFADFIAGCVVMWTAAKAIQLYQVDSKYLLSVTNVVLGNISLFSVLMSTVALSIDRLNAITKALEYRRNLGWKRCIVVTVAIWIISIGIGLFSSQSYQSVIMTVLSGIIATIFHLIGVFTMGVIYYRVRTFLRNHDDEFHSQLQQYLIGASEEAIAQRCSTERKINQTFLLFFIVMMLTYVPAFILLIIIWYCQYFGACDCKSRFIVVVVHLLFLVSNSACNVFICTIRLKDFKESLRALFRKTRNSYT